MNKLKVLRENRSNTPGNKIQTILAIAAGKGGVGKSAVSVHLAHYLKDRGAKVGILDADIYGPSLAQMLPEGVQPVEQHENPEVFYPALSHGIAYISVAHFRKNASIVRAPVANRIIEQFLHAVEWGELDYLLIDFPPGTGDIQLTLMQKAMIDGAVVVTLPQIVSTIDVRKAIQLFEKMHIPVLGVIENMSYFLNPISGNREKIFGEGGAAALAKEFSLPVLGQIPLDPALSAAADGGVSVFDAYKSAPSTQALLALGEEVIERCRAIKREHSKVGQIDVHHLEFSHNGISKIVSLHSLQKKCPCARCGGVGSSDPMVSLLEFSLIGRYAIKVNFSSGCSQGIYPFTLLEQCVEL